ncbi:MAG: carbohydrate ABC transporter permease [Candidatus Melainabacteria bacterium]
MRPAVSDHALERHHARWAWLLILPGLLGLLVFTYLPTLSSFALSFSYWNLLGAPQWVGLENYREVLADPLFWQSLVNTLVFVSVATLVQVTLAVAVAVALNRITVLRTALRTTYFLPFITPMVSVAMVWGWLYEPQAGLFNWILEHLHLIQAPVAWLYEPQTALGAVILLQIWKGVGYNVVLFLAGLQAVPESVYESAQLDGAGSWSAFWRITLPMITPTLFFVLTMTIISSFQVFDSVYLLTEGGPQHSTDVLVYWMFKNAFAFYKIGPASAIAYLIFVMVLALTLVQWQLRTRWVLYEDEGGPA